MIIDIQFWEMTWKIVDFFFAIEKLVELPKNM